MSIVAIGQVAERCRLPVRLVERAAAAVGIGPCIIINAVPYFEAAQVEIILARAEELALAQRRPARLTQAEQQR